MVEALPGCLDGREPGLDRVECHAWSTDYSLPENAHLRDVANTRRGLGAWIHASGNPENGQDGVFWDALASLHVSPVATRASDTVRDDIPRHHGRPRAPSLPVHRLKECACERHVTANMNTKFDRDAATTIVADGNGAAPIPNILT